VMRAWDIHRVLLAFDAVKIQYHATWQEKL
jgi:hypothetical protein